MKRTCFLLCALALTGCTRFFFYPDGLIYDRPEHLGLVFDTPTFPSLDGTKITGIFFASKTAPARGTVVHFHGNGGNITAHWSSSYWLAEYGFNVFVLDYRGYGASAGTPSARGAARDAIAALNYVAARPEVDPRKILVFGQSLGAAIAVAALAQTTVPVRAVVLESPFSSYRSIAREKLSLFWLTRWLKWPLSLIVSDRYNPGRLVKKLPKIPLLFILGTADDVIPMDQSLPLHEAAAQPKQLWIIPGGGHIEAFTRFGDKYRPQLVKFFEQALL